ncbi:MBL fold metallo-hydrolase [Listeria grandensis]|uniref:MBL fold metallo-hydrolase n=1 Tax=Listeria grandensis TaxID=1494963 RepID=UPI00164E9D85|nr:MBL fold metallo-hydrolase [Listeria grandensis]MBC6315083.1 MBL fold metallo-hydrolase [Listeria grandensis]
MKLTVFGHWGGYPKVDEGTSSYLLEEDGFKLLIDVGASAVSIMQNYVDPNEIDAAIISHYHPDHVADVGILQHYRLIGGMNRDVSVLPVYGHEEDARGFSYLSMPNVSEGIAYDPSKPLHVGPFTITFLKTVHPVVCYAMRMEANGKVFVFTADSAYQESFVPFAKGADLLMADTNFYKEFAGTSKIHMASTEVGKLAQDAGVTTLLLSHLPQFGELATLKSEAASAFDGQIVLAEKGLIIEF